MNEQLTAFKKLLNIMDELRAKCPWDSQQTFESLRNLTIEETYELADAIIKQDIHEIKNELGDLMLHIVFYAKIASELKEFNITDVLNTLCEKLIYRHPHIYGNVDVGNDANKVKENWEEIKLKQHNKKVLSGVPKSLPALIKATRIQEKVRAVGFDWDVREQIWDKVAEEMEELQTEIKRNKKDKIIEEFGDLLFSLVNAARLYDIDPETALEQTNQKFINRFNYLEEKTIRTGKSLKSMNLDELNQYWDDAKKNDKKKL